MNKNSFSKAIGANPQTTHKIISNVNFPGFEYIESILSTFSYVSAEWLLRGEGEMKKDNEQSKVNNSDNDNVWRNKVSTLEFELSKQEKIVAVLEKEVALLDRTILRLEKENERLNKKVPDEKLNSEKK